MAGYAAGEVVGNIADGVNMAWYGGEAAYHLAQGNHDQAQEAGWNAAMSGVALLPFGNFGKAGQWLGKTDVGQWGGNALRALGALPVGHLATDGLGWVSKQSGNLLS